jgi:hypothetical protein
VSGYDHCKNGNRMSVAMAAGLAIAWLIAPCVTAVAQEKPSASLMADFEGPAALEGWRFVGTDSRVQGTLGLAPGHNGRGAVLQYQIPCDADTDCHGSAAALWKPGSPMAVGGRTMVSVWIRRGATVAVLIQCKDTGGHTTEFPIPVASLEQPRMGEWQHAVIPLTEGSNRVKGRIAELGIIVRTRSTAAGAVSIDDLRVEQAAEVFELRAEASVDPPVAGAEAITPRLGVNIHVLYDDVALDRAREVGFTFVRMDLLWADVERSGRYNFGGYDALLAALDARGMGALWILDYGHPDHGGQTPHTAQDVAAFSRFAAAAAAHFRGRKVQYEIWNEPNLPQFWKPAPNAAEYSALLHATVAAMRAADPAAVISSGGVSRFDGKFLSEMIDLELTRQLNAIAIHPYRSNAPESVAEEWALVSDWARRAFGARPEIWNTEWGYSSVDPSDDSSNGHSADGRQRQAVLAVRELLTVWALGMPLAVWYDLRDDSPDGRDPEKNYGLLDTKGNDKPAMSALLTLMKTAKGRTFVGWVRDTPAGIHAMRFDGTTDTVMVVWSDRPGVQQTVAASKTRLLSVSSLTGELVKTKEKPAGFVQWVLKDSAGPVYLRWGEVTR